MRGLAVFVLLVSCLVAGTPAAGAAGAHGPGPAGPPASVADEILVRFKPGVSGRDIAAAHAWAGGQVVREFRIVDKLQLVRVPPGLDVKQVIERYEQLSDVLYAEPN